MLPSMAKGLFADAETEIILDCLCGPSVIIKVVTKEIRGSVSEREGDMTMDTEEKR